MPILLNGDTFWVDVCPESKEGETNSDGTSIAKDSIMLNLDMEGSGGTDTKQTGNQGNSSDFEEAI